MIKFYGDINELLTKIFNHSKMCENATEAGAHFFSMEDYWLRTAGVAVVIHADHIMARADNDSFEAIGLF